MVWVYWGMGACIVWYGMVWYGLVIGWGCWGRCWGGKRNIFPRKGGDGDRWMDRQTERQTDTRIIYFVSVWRETKQEWKWMDVGHAPYSGHTSKPHIHTQLRPPTASSVGPLSALLHRIHWFLHIHIHVHIRTNLSSPRQHKTQDRKSVV